jgi:hypothetical protein
MLVLKLTLVPTFLLMLSLAGKRWGPSVAGWLAGLPVVAGPILFFVALEQGNEFAAAAASSTLAAIFTLQSFSVSYSHVAWRSKWPVALGFASCAWLIAALLVAELPNSLSVSLGIAAATLVLAPRLFPVLPAEISVRAVASSELAVRLCAGAALTVVVTLAAGKVGSQWSGILVAFPILTSVMAVFSHRGQGTAFTSALLRATATGLYSFAAFFLVISVALPRTGALAAFAVATAVSVVVQAATRRHLTLHSSGLPAAGAE